ncbi:MAG: hypothetical protein HY790_05535 [Deltaproteobacteria bacterium]|nr:hypothetical protein [Deltaproteobacteria bacterium]
MGKQKKVSGTGVAGLPPLPADAATALKDLTARAAAGLEEGRDPESLRQMLVATTGDPVWDLHLMAALSRLAHPGVPGLLAALFGANLDKPRRKALKRALHLLKTRGVPVPEDLLPREEAASLRAPGRGPALAYVSQVLGNGERYVILEGPKEVLGGNFLVSLVSDQEGIQECHLLSIKSRQRQEFWDHFRQQGLAELATPPPAYAVRLLEEADSLKPDAEGSSRYRSLKQKIWQEWGRPEDAPDLEALLPPLNPGEQSRLLDQSRDLALNPLFHSWLPGPEELTPWLQKLREVQESPLILSDQQRQARVGDVVDEAVLSLYPPEARERWRGRLLAMAYFLDLRGPGPEARLAQAAAQDLAGAPRGPLAGENPFLKALVWEALKMALEFLEQTQKEAASSSPLLAPPTESLLIRR